jgi:hypothetical protein
MSAQVIVSCYVCDDDIKLNSDFVRIIVPAVGDFPFYSFTCTQCETYSLRVLPRREVFDALRKVGVQVLTAPAEVFERDPDAPVLTKDELLTFCLELKEFTHLEEDLVEE